jgi:hypothetical protein
MPSLSIQSDASPPRSIAWARKTSQRIQFRRSDARLLAVPTAHESVSGRHAGLKFQRGKGALSISRMRSALL